MEPVQGMGARSYERLTVMDYAMVQSKAGGTPFRSVVIDIGLGGVQLRSSEKLPVGEICELQIGTDTGNALILKGEVRYSNPVPENDLFTSGFKFLPENHDERRAIAEYVHSVFMRHTDHNHASGQRIA